MIGSGTPSKNRMIERIRLSPDWLNFLGHREARPPTQDLARECRVQPRPQVLRYLPPLLLCRGLWFDRWANEKVLFPRRIGAQRGLADKSGRFVLLQGALSPR